MRVGEGERLVAPATAAPSRASRSGSPCAPSRYTCSARREPAPNGGSRLTGTLAEIVYLGMYTQFHVETPAGRVVAHRLADEEPPDLEARRAGAVSWDSEDASLL